MPHRVTRPRLARLAGASLLLLAAPAALRAQEGAPPDDAPVCLGFAFGAWSPKLDWKAAGHAPLPAGARGTRRPGGATGRRRRRASPGTAR